MGGGHTGFDIVGKTSASVILILACGGEIGVTGRL